jgi:hypothetical protein
MQNFSIQNYFQKLFGFILLSGIIAGFSASVKAQTASEIITIDVTSKKKVFTRNIGKNLLLRVVKDSSVKNKDFGWLIEVVKKPHHKKSENLIYQNKTGTTADASQIYAWHVSSGEFPNERELQIKDFPYSVKILLVDSKTVGEGPDSKFISGKLKVILVRHK